MKDPDRSATMCPHSKCKAKIEAKPDDAPTKTAWGMTMTEKSNEIQERVENAGTDGTLPMSEDQQDAHDRAQVLQAEI